MKKSWIKRGTKELTRSTSLKRTKLRVAGTSDNATAKREIQSTLREFVMLRDGGCILRDIRHCGGEIGKAVMQADHLLPRSNAETYADERLVVLLCRPCHGGFKQWHKEEYDRLVKSILPKEIVELWEKCEEGRRGKTGKYDWRLELISLNQRLEKLKKEIK